MSQLLVVLARRSWQKMVRFWLRQKTQMRIDIPLKYSAKKYFAIFCQEIMCGLGFGERHGFRLTSRWNILLRNILPRDNVRFGLRRKTRMRKDVPLKADKRTGSRKGGTGERGKGRHCVSSRFSFNFTAPRWMRRNYCESIFFSFRRQYNIRVEVVFFFF